MTADIIQFNCDGISSNSTYIRQLLCEFEPKIVLLQELKLPRKSKINFKGYSLIHKSINPNEPNFPSVGILIKDGIHFEKIDIAEDWTVIGINVVIGVPMSIYSYYDNPRLNKLSTKQLEKIISYGKFDGMLLGDFNAHSTLWDKEFVNNTNQNVNINRENSIIKFLNNSDYVLLNDGSLTRISPIFNHRSSAIDLSIVNKNLEFNFEWSVSKERFGSDHLPIFLVSNKSNETIHKRVIWDLNTTNWNLFHQHCVISQEDLDESIEPVNWLDQEFTRKITMGLEASTKSFKFPNNKKRSPPWYDDEVNKLRIEKNRSLYKYLKTKSKEDLVYQKKTNALYKNLIKKKKEESWERFVEEMDEELELKDLWKRVKKVKGVEMFKKITHLKDVNGDVTDDPNLIPNILANFFQQVSSKDNLDLSKRKIYQDIQSSNDSNFDDYKYKELDEEFSMKEMLIALQNTKDSSPGPDGFKYKIYKKLDLNLQKMLLKLYNMVWFSGKRPDSWKISHVIPIPKSKNADTPDKIRPINLINTRPKLFDKMVNNRLMFCLESDHSIGTAQFGFRQNKQTLDSMLKLDEFVNESRKDGLLVQLISFDIKKAFDSVWPVSVIKKLKQIGFGGRMLNYVEDYLGTRTFFVMNNGFLSNPVEVDLGVPQGSPLSSTLFLVVFQLILDQLDKLNKNIMYSAYADDLILYNNNRNGKSSIQDLRRAINKITNVGMKIGLEFSTSKTKCICIGRKSGAKKMGLYMYGNPIEQVQQLKILGLTIQSNYLFNQHINLLKLKLVKDLNILKMMSTVKYSINQDTMRKIIIALVVSKIRYCIEIYGYTSKENQNKINVMINHFKRLLLKSFCSTPISTLTIQSGIPDFETIKKKSTLLRYSNQNEITKVNEIENKTRKNEIINGLEEMLLYSQDENDVLEFTRIEKEITFISPQRVINPSVFTNIFKKKKEDIEPTSVYPILKDFLNEKGINVEVYTDGSKTVLGTAYAVSSNCLEPSSIKIHPESSVFTSEARAVLAAVSCINQHITNQHITNQHVINQHVINQHRYAIITDSRSVLEQIISNKKCKSQIVNKIINTVSSNTIFIWVPSHTGVPGNEIVDKMANQATYLIEQDIFLNNIITSADYKSVVRRFIRKKQQIVWNNEIENKLRNVYSSVEYVPSWNISKKEQMIINRLRSGHTFLTHSYLIPKESPPECKHCSEVLTVRHIFECDTFYSKSYKCISGSTTSWKEDLFSCEKFEKIKKFLVINDYYNLI